MSIQTRNVIRNMFHVDRHIICGPGLTTRLTYIVIILFVMQSYIVGIIVPDEEVLMKWATDNGLTQTFGELCQNKVCPLQIIL